MLDFSFAEIALIVVVAVIFIGPNELPAVVRAITKAFRALKLLTGEAKQLFEEVSREAGLKDTARELHREIHMIRGDDGKMYESYMLPKASSDETINDETNK